MKHFNQIYSMETKICPYCTHNLPIGNFRYLPKIKRYNSYCNRCQSAQQIKRWINIKIKAINLLGGKCANPNCGFVGHYACYDFHHNYDKDVDWNSLRKRSWIRIVAELEKCTLLCANCHRTIHATPEMMRPAGIEPATNGLNLQHSQCAQSVALPIELRTQTTS